MTRRDLHHEFQKALFYHRDLLVGRYPLLKALYAVPNGGKRDKVTAAKLKAEGATAGVWDCHLPVGIIKFAPNEPFFPDEIIYHGLWIEIKIGKDNLSPEQIAWQELLEPLGHKFYVARDLQETLNYILAYLRGEV
jgi:hypothetical protein